MPRPLRGQVRRGPAGQQASRAAQTRAQGGRSWARGRPTPPSCKWYACKAPWLRADFSSRLLASTWDFHLLWLSSSILLSSSLESLCYLLRLPGLFSQDGLRTAESAAPQYHPSRPTPPQTTPSAPVPCTTPPCFSHAQDGQTPPAFSAAPSVVPGEGVDPGRAVVGSRLAWVCGEQRAEWDGAS